MPFARAASSSRRTLGVRSTILTNPDLKRLCCPTKTFSSAVMFENSLMFWNVRAMPREVMSDGDILVISLPSNINFPLVGLYNPVIMLKKVVLPAPFGPIRLTMAPRGITKSTLLTATRPPKLLVMACASRSKLPPALELGGDSGGVGELEVCRSAILFAPLHAGAYLLALAHIVEFFALRGADALRLRVQLGAAARAGQQTLRAEEHEQHQDSTVDKV